MVREGSDGPKVVSTVQMEGGAYVERQFQAMRKAVGQSSGQRESTDVSAPSVLSS
jgi:hypothetical protein